MPIVHVTRGWDGGARGLMDSFKRPNTHAHTHITHILSVLCGETKRECRRKHTSIHTRTHVPRSRTRLAVSLAVAQEYLGFPSRRARPTEPCVNDAPPPVSRVCVVGLVWPRLEDVRAGGRARAND